MIHISKDQLNQLIDETFAFLATVIPATNLFVRLGLDAVHSVAKVGLDALYDALLTKGVIAKAS